MRFVLLAALSCCLLATPPAAHAATPVDQRLAERGIKFKVDADGDYRVIYNYEQDHRTQLVFVAGHTETADPLVVREVFSPAAKVDDERVDRAALLGLMRDSHANKLGSWELSGDVLLYVVKLPDDVSAAGLETAMDLAATIADDMELKLTGKDDF